MLIKKKNYSDNPQKIETDIIYGFNKIIRQNLPIYFITITKKEFEVSTEFDKTSSLSFYLKNILFNRMRKDYLNSYEIINFLFVIEYPETVSRGNHIPDNCDIHAHIVLATTINKQHIEYYIETTFNRPDIDIKRIDNRNDKSNLSNYLLKQNKKKLLTCENYNYKIEI